MVWLHIELYKISMCLNVFINIVIGILPSYSHCNTFAMHTYLHIFFHSTQWLPSQHVILLHYFFSIPIDPFQLSYNQWKNYISILTSRLYITPHSTFHIPHSMSSPHIPRSTFHVITSCVEHSGAQV
jgi:hypothetical protein